MKTSRFYIIGWALLALLASAGPAEASVLNAGPTLSTVCVVVGQANPQQDPRMQVAQLLAAARQAMADGQLDTADRFITQAQGLGVKFGAFTLKDTPEKARRDLTNLKSSGGSRGLSKFVPAFLKPDEKPTTDPFTAANRGPMTNPPVQTPMAVAPRAPMPTQPGAPASGVNQANYNAPANPGAAPQVRRLPSFGAVQPLPPAPANGPTPRATANNPEARQKSDALLLESRRALAVGDTRRARGMVAQARTLGVRYALHDDEPAKIESAIGKFEQLQARRQAGENDESYWRQYGRLLLEQGEWMVRWRQFDEAERLANDAQKLPVKYSPFEPNPKALMSRIAEARQPAAQFRQQPAPRTTITAIQPGPAEPLPVEPGAPDTKTQVTMLVRQARAALNAGDINTAGRLASQAASLNVPDSAFGPQDDRPSFVMLDIQKAMSAGAGQAPAAVIRAGGVGQRPSAANRLAFNPGAQPGGVRPAQAVEAAGPVPPSPNPPATAGDLPAPQAPTANNEAMRLYQSAEQALQNSQFDQARQLFQQAAAKENQLDPETRARIRGRLQYLGQPRMENTNSLAQQHSMLRRQASAEMANAQREARKLQVSRPKEALVVLENARAKMLKAGLDDQSREQLMRRVDGDIQSMRRYIEENASRIALDDRNRGVREDIDRERKYKVEVEAQLAYMVDEFNKLMDQQRYAEAEAVARRATELAPDEPVVRQLKWMNRFVRQQNEIQEIQTAKEGGFVAAMNSVDASAEPMDDRFPFRFPDNWADITKRRQGFRADRKRSAKEIEIEQKLRTPVSLRFQNTPLKEVMDYLATLAEVNLHLDPQGLAEEGVGTDTPVTIDLREDISLKSALNLILQPLHLSYVVKDEVLKITSENLRDSEVYTVTYNVADLVIPIPNFVPTANMGMAGALNEAYRQTGFYGGGFGGHAPVTAVASKTGGTTSTTLDPTVLANMSSSGMPNAHSYGGASSPMGSGPGGLGGGSQADFDSLISLITTTVAPQTWEEVGGPGSVAPFETNLSLVVSQTQEVHEQIADLLEQLRRLQDLQVTIEVRFITLNDNFFERIGVDFDFDINDNTDAPFQVFGRTDPTVGTAYAPSNALNVGAGNPNRDVQDRDHGPSTTVGLSMPGVFSADLDIPVQQGSFALAVPQFGGFQPGAGATVGFAILSDLEAYFFIEASQGDRRSNVLQAPKVTLFNGQQAIVSDTSQSPFVISVIPVVGDFAAAQQPVIVVLNEGTFLNVQAVVSNDRRFVRLTVVPFFSTIGDVSTFTFEGSATTLTESEQEANGDDNTPARPAQTRQSRQGTTVQLPTFSFVTVTTTVSVPDGGTVLLGGIKRLSEGRNEFGVPILSKVPYVSRLFRNVAIGRETQSLMMMVTPRIIIQEEEEAILLGNQPTGP